MDKKEFLEKFKQVVKGKAEKNVLSYGQIISRIQEGDISQSDLAPFLRYIPRDLILPIQEIMSKRAIAGIIKAAKQIEDDVKKFNKDLVSGKLTTEDIVKLIKADKITQKDVQKNNLSGDKAIADAITKQIGKFIKVVVTGKETERNAIEKMLRRGIVTKEFINNQKNIKDILNKYFGDEYKRYIEEEPFRTELKNAIDSDTFDYKLAGDLPSYSLKDFQNKVTNLIQDPSTPKQDIIDLIKGVSKLDINRDGMKNFDGKLLEFISNLEQAESKKEETKITKRLKEMGFMTKTKKSKKEGSIISDIRKQMVLKRQKRENEEDREEDKAGIPETKSTTNIYSVQKKITGLKSGKKQAKSLNRIERKEIEEEFRKQLNIVIKKKQGSVKSKPKSPSLSRRVSESSSSESSSSEAKSSPIKRRRSSTSSMESLFGPSSSASGSPKSPERFVKERSITPVLDNQRLVRLGSPSREEVDPNTLNLIYNFSDKSIVYTAGKKSGRIYKKKQKKD